ncbi:hypothetical protein A5787_13725 [Mycobacterium sp. 852002-50816_SCH5313054-b]|uniref:hypothetical protein n=1 Tax=Mycobacterium sp. 852002-50816_SCH5313054-b TaxID=1834092 RepID=UPI0007FF0E8B|nr:hypothetical protein [Mycobacterium sp. 852002-50816_SCH5313054-b]OBF44133.1 hypothetical protein A5787_13725 [Mycobacterium sp. 852002-50816_SCH5313054-b]
MNVEELRRALAHLPGGMPIAVEDSTMGWMENAALYVAPAHIDQRVSGSYLYARHRDGADNCHALLISSLHQPDERVVDVTPKPAGPEVIAAGDAAHLTTRRAARRSDEVARRRGRHT